MAALVAARALPAPPKDPDVTFVRSLAWTGVVDLKQILTYATPAYGGDTWAAALASLMSCPSDAETVHTLAAELTAKLAADPQATFDLPARVEFFDPDDWDEDDVAEHGPCPVLPRVANGMHRIAASHLVGAKSLLCAEGDDADPDEGVEYVEVSFRLHGIPVAAGTDLEDAEIEFYDWFRSFRLNDTTWVESDSQSITPGGCEFMWTCPHRYADDLVAELEARTAVHGGRFELVNIRTTTSTELDAEHEAWQASRS